MLSDDRWESKDEGGDVPMRVFAHASPEHGLRGRWRLRHVDGREEKFGKGALGTREHGLGLGEAEQAEKERRRRKTASKFLPVQLQFLMQLHVLHGRVRDVNLFLEGLALPRQ